ncbi:TonB-dependent receptor [Flavobacterium gilvum]|uniref:TonB-dependent receptor n=1 Tax=Flavobacterium gilvum TaxID=1492737 RepID=A0AAC9I565_9FLAO|nr:TonB-dependent receptor [Flavobacterium gilvum]AOW09606.1 TonB-dependent receptor [Flavobacterium gilvum]KFC58557.1 TonB-denpendent receptor [Flavobacterium gilvum]
MKNIFPFFIAFLFSVISVFGQGNASIKGGTIKGIIQTSDNKPAEGVSLSIKGTNKNTISGNNGIYEIKNIPAGTHILIVTLVGYKDINKEIIITSKGITIQDLKLDLVNQELNQVVILSNKSTFKTNRISSSLRLQGPIIEIPQNIQVITGKLMQNQQIFDMLEGVSRNVSGATRVEHWDNYARITMRGSQVSAFRNGMNMSTTWGPLTEDMSMVERIEFVKGPAGFMLATGNPSGFYNVVTKKPSGRNKAEASFTYGSDNLFRGTFDLDGKLTKDGKLLYRLNVMGQKRDSYRDFDFNDRYSFAPVLKYLPTDNTSITLEYTQQFSKVNAIGANYLFMKNGYEELPRSNTTSEPNLDPTDMLERSLLGIIEHKFDDNWRVTFQGDYMNYQQEGIKLWPNGFDPNNDAILKRAGSNWDILGKTYIAQSFVNGNFKTGAVSHKLLGGIDISEKTYYHDWNQYFTMPDLDVYNPVHGTLPSSPTFDRSKDIKERGVKYKNNYTASYIQDEIGFLDDRLRLTLAGRYTLLKATDAYSGGTSNDKFTPRIGLSYSLNSDNSFYFVRDESFTENYGTDWQGKSFNPQTGTNLELGYKKDWFNGKWNSVLAAYQITMNNVLTIDPDHSNGSMQYNKEGGQHKIKGIEVDVRGEILKNFDVIANYAFTEGRVTEDTDPTMVGNQIPGSTKHIQSTWLNYTFDNGFFNGFGASLGYQYQVKRAPWFISPNNTGSLPDYFRLDGGLSYQFKKVSINLIVNNILNQYLYSGGYDSYGDMYYLQAEAGTNARINITYKF